MGPFPRLHFFLVSQAPLLDTEGKKKVKVNVKELTTQAYSERNFYSNVKSADGKYLAVALTFRGKMSSSEVDNEVRALNDNLLNSLLNGFQTMLNLVLLKFHQV